MAALRYLWINRTRFSERKFLFYKAWAKRFLTFPEAMKREVRRRRLINKGALIHATAEIGQAKFEGKIEKLVIGAYSFIGKAELALHDKIVIESNVCISDGAKLLSGSHNINDPVWRLIRKPIFIDDYVWIATNAIILPGVSIGKGAVIGAGAVVSKDVEPFSIMVGNPAKPLSKKREKTCNYNPCHFLASNAAWLGE